MWTKGFDGGEERGGRRGGRGEGGESSSSREDGIKQIGQREEKRIKLEMRRENQTKERGSNRAKGNRNKGCTCGGMLESTEFACVRTGRAEEEEEREEERGLGVVVVVVGGAVVQEKNQSGEKWKEKREIEGQDEKERNKRRKKDRGDGRQ